MEEKEEVEGRERRVRWVMGDIINVRMRGIWRWVMVDVMGGRCNGPREQRIRVEGQCSKVGAV